MLTLKRNWVYLLMFVFLPIIMMGGFWYLETMIDIVVAPERQHTDKTKFTKFNFQKSFSYSGMKKKQANVISGNVTALTGCRKFKRKDVGMVAPEEFIHSLYPLVQKKMKEKSMNVWAFPT